MAVAASGDPGTALRIHTREELGVDPDELPSPLLAASRPSGIGAHGRIVLAGANTAPRMGRVDGRGSTVRVTGRQVPGDRARAGAGRSTLTRSGSCSSRVPNGVAFTSLGR